MVEERTPVNEELFHETKKLIIVGTPRGQNYIAMAIPRQLANNARQFPIGRLNQYNRTMKKHRGSVELNNYLHRIEEDENSKDKVVALR